MNESEKNLSKLVNGAFVGRQLSEAKTNRFAGGIIGNQNNSTSKDWTIDTCINFGTVYCYRSHYSGGISGPVLAAISRIARIMEICRQHLRQIG